MIAMTIVRILIQTKIYMYNSNFQEQHLNAPIGMIINTDPDMNMKKSLYNIRKILKLLKKSPVRISSFEVTKNQREKRAMATI